MARGEKKRDTERERSETETIWLVTLVAGQLPGRESAVLPWQYAFFSPRVTGQGTISGVSVVQEAAEIRALISQH